MRSLRVMTFNVHHGLGADGVLDIGRAADLIREAAPDFAALQEVDRGWPRSGNLDQVHELARLTGYDVSFHPTVVTDEGAEYGHAILTKGPVEMAHVALPRLGDTEPRAAIIATTLETTFVATHLSRTAEARTTQIGFLAGLAAELDPPVVVLGDLNTGRKSLGPLLAAGFDPGPRAVRTVPSRFARVQLDHILAGPGAHLTRLRSIRTHISDHRPLIGTLALIHTAPPAASRRAP